MTRRTLRTAALATTALVATAFSAAAEYPERPITMIVPFAAGGGTDVTARTVEPFLEKYLGGDIVVENVPGGSGELGATRIAQAEPDGYTIGWMNVTNTMANAYARDTAYETPGSFEPIANVVFDAAMVVVHPDSQFETFEQLLEYAAENPGDLTFATSGISSDSHLNLLMLHQESDARLTHVPFEGGAASRAALLGGHVDVLSSTRSEVQPYQEEGEVRILAAWTEDRLEMLPDVPTLKEHGLDLTSGSWRGLVAPAGTPREIVDQLAEAVEQMVKDPEFQERAEQMRLGLEYMDADQYLAFLTDWDERLTALWEAEPWQ
jgi:tripartite-type tricarboxylate transporter receptor subunit TctC